MFAPLLALAFFLVPADSTATPPDSMLALLMQAVHAYVAPYDGPGEDVQLKTEWADVNGDGVADALVYVNATSWCGSGGCTVLVFETVTGDDVEELGAFRPAAEISLMHGPVEVSKTTHEGWADLIVEKADGQRVALQFDGETYPQSPADGVAVADGVPGSLLFANAE